MFAYIFVGLCMAVMALAMFMRIGMPAIREWREKRKVARREHQRKKAFAKVGSMMVEMQDVWFGRPGASYKVQVILMENGYGERQFISSDDDVRNFPPLAYWLRGGPEAEVKKMFEKTKLYAA